MNKRLIGIFSILLLASSLFLVSTQVGAHQEHQDFLKVICHHMPGNNVTLTFQNSQAYQGHLGQPHNGQTFDTDGACTQPTATPTITPTPTKQPKYCEGGEAYSIRQLCPTMEPSPTSGQSATPTPEQPHQDVSDGRSSNPGATEAHNPACTINFAAPLLQGFVFHKDTGIQSYSWWASTEPGITKQSVEYGYEIGNPLYGADNLNPNQTSIDIFGLDPLRISWLRVIAWKGQCPAYSNWFN